MADRIDATRNAAGQDAKSGQTKAAVVKKYANRRLYNTATSSYVTLEELSAMVRQGDDFVVFDAKSGEDITRSVLTQIILEEDSKGRNLMPIGFLRQLIRYYDDSLQSVVPRYLEVSMENFSKHQDQMRGYVENTFGRFFPVANVDPANPFEDMARQNMAFLNQAARMFSPFPEDDANAAEQCSPQHAAASKAPQQEKDEAPSDVETLKRQLEAMQRQLDLIAAKR